MSRKAKVEITAESVRKAIEDGKFSSLTGLAHSLGYKGSVSSSLTRKLRAILPDVDSLLASGKADASTSKAAKAKAAKLTAKSKGRKWTRHPQNPFREGSAYGTCFDILADANPDGLPRECLVELLAKVTGKPPKLVAFDVQVVLSARGAASEGLNPFEGPRNRSARFGYWVERLNGHVRLVLPAAKGTP